MSSWAQNGSYDQLVGRKRVELAAKWILCPTRREQACRVGRKMDLMSNSQVESVSSWSQNGSYAQLGGRKRVEFVAKRILCPTRHLHTQRADTFSPKKSPNPPNHWKYPTTPNQNKQNTPLDQGTLLPQ